MPSREPDLPHAFRLYALPTPEEVDDEALEERAARETSREIWHVLRAGTTYQELTAALEDTYDGHAGRAAADIDAFLAARRRQGLQAS